MADNDLAKAFSSLLNAEAKHLPSRQRDTFMSLWPFIYSGINLGYALLSAVDRHNQVILTASLDAMCSSGLNACDGMEDELGNVARMNFRAARDLLNLAMIPGRQPKQLVEAGLNSGVAEVRANLLLSGLYAVVEEGQANFESAQQVQAARESGGAKRGAQMTATADVWKVTVLPYVAQQDRKNPKWTRDRLATEITHQFEGEVPGHKAVTDWLKDEAEEPNGPIRSRARKKSA